MVLSVTRFLLMRGAYELVDLRRVYALMDLGCGGGRSFTVLRGLHFCVSTMKTGESDGHLLGFIRFSRMFIVECIEYICRGCYTIKKTREFYKKLKSFLQDDYKV